MNRVAIVDYGMGNLASVRRALAELGAEPRIAAHPHALDEADRIILPGVGSFTDGMAHLSAHGWPETLHREVAERGKPLLGICLGMQLLASRGTEGASGGFTPGLDLVPGDVVKLDGIGCRLRIPHVGWNAVEVAQAGGLFEGIPSGTDFYFVHSYAFQPAEAREVLGRVDYGVPVTAAVGTANVVGTQFHPEKSSKAGFRLLRNFLAFSSC